MPNLRIALRWERFVPDLPGNRAAPAPFYFELAADMTKAQFQALQEQLSAADDFPNPPQDETAEAARVRVAEQRATAIRRAAEALSPYVHFGNEPLVINETPIKTLEEYLSTMSSFQTLAYAREVSSALTRANSIVDHLLFSERLSGGFTSTRNPNAG